MGKLLRVNLTLSQVSRLEQRPILRAVAARAGRGSHDPARDLTEGLPFVDSPTSNCPRRREQGRV